MVISLAVLFGWRYNIPELKSVLVGSVSMRLNTALCLLGLAIGYEAIKNRWRIVAIILASLVIGISLGTLIEYVAHLNLGIDEYFQRDPDGIYGLYPPGRPAPITAICLTALAVSSLLHVASIRRKKGRASRADRTIYLRQALAGIVLFASFQVFVGYAIGVTNYFGFSFYTRMALHTAFCLFLLATADLRLRMDTGAMEVLAGKTASSKLTRWTVLAGLFIPVIVRWLGQTGVTFELYDADFAQLVQTVGISALMVVITLIFGSALLRQERRAYREKKLVDENQWNNFRKLFSEAPEIVCVLSGTEHRFELVNEAHVQLLGFDATGKTVREAQPESVEAHGLLDAVYTTGETAKLFRTPITLGSKLRYFNLTYAAHRDADGEINGILVLGNEVSDEVFREQAAAFQSRALEAALNGSPLSEVLELLVTMAERQTGNEVFGSVHLLDDTGTRLVHAAAPSLPPSLNRYLENILIGSEATSAGAAAASHQKSIVTNIATDVRWAQYKDAPLALGFRACWAVPVTSSQNKLLGVFSLYARETREPTAPEWQILEITARTMALMIERQVESTERLRSTQALAESESRLNLALYSGQIGLWDWNAETGYVYLSDTMIKQWGINPDNFTHTLTECMALIHPYDRERVWNEIQNSTFERRAYDVDYRIQRADDQHEIWINAKGRYFLNNAGSPERLTGISLDISGRRMAAAELRLAKEEAERANSMKSAFLANMSHEIRTPLGAISGFVDLLKAPEVTRRETLEYIGVVERNAVQLLRIIDDILDLSKVEAGKMQIEQVEFSLIELLADFSSLMTFKARDKGVEFEMSVGAALPDAVISDPTRLRQILTNIVGNAIKFTEKGRVQMLVTFTDKRLKFRVIDTGTGLSTAQIEKLFQPFQQADVSTTRKFGGTGLGLVLTRHLAEALGGSFILESSVPESGSVFTAEIPVDIAPTARLVDGRALALKIPLTTDISLSEPPLHGMRVLVVDDSVDNQVLFRLMLTKAGARVAIAGDGLDGVNTALADDFDVMLLDVQMPRMDGHEATRLLRAKGYDRPIIALTAHAMIEERNRALESGFTDFLSKPVQRERLIELVRHYRSSTENSKGS